ncbi:MAG: A24 family peptidase [Bacillota bacterium]
MILFDLLVAALTAACAWTDLRAKKIYNVVLLPFALAGIFFHIYFYGPKGLLEGLAGLATGLFLLLIPFLLRQMGGGDVKLLAVIGLLKGPQFALAVFLGAALAGGLLACLLLIRQGRLLSFLQSLGYAVVFRLARAPAPYAFPTLEKAAPGETLPFGVAISAGVLAAYLLGSKLG